MKNIVEGKVSPKINAYFPPCIKKSEQPKVILRGNESYFTQQHSRQHTYNSSHSEVFVFEQG